MITVNARSKQTAQLTAKQLRSGIRIRILLTCLKRVILRLKLTQNFTNLQQYLEAYDFQSPALSIMQSTET